MSDLISRQAVLDLFQDNVSTLHNYARVWEAVEEMPSVTPSERTGHWIRERVSPRGVRFRCSECGRVSARGENYCPKCGAKMVEPHESEVTDADSN